MTGYNLRDPQTDTETSNDTFYEYTFVKPTKSVQPFDIVLCVLGLCLLWVYLFNQIKHYIQFAIILAIAFVFVYFMYKLFTGVKKENLIVIKNVGLQITVTYYSTKASFRFIPWASIDDVIINEAIRMQQVINYLAVLVKNEDGSDLKKNEIVPIFLHCRPRLQELKDIYRAIQSILN